MKTVHAIVLTLILASASAGAAADAPAAWRAAWPDTDFARHAVPFGEFMSGGPPKDGIPPIDRPAFVAAAAGVVPDREPVIGFAHDGDARAYPLRVLVWHEIVNDVVGGRAVAVTYCPLCNAAIVFDRRHDGRLLDFGTTGMLRHSDLVMYDRQTESWWQQFTGEAIVGELTGARLDMLPARLESYASFLARHPDGRVLVPGNPDLRPYGATPYAGYDHLNAPFLYRGETPPNVTPLERVVTVDGRAWTLSLLQTQGRIETADGLVLTWEPGQASAMDSPTIADGMDVGNVVVRRRTGAGSVDVRYGVDYAFAFHAFNPETPIVTALD